MTLRLIGAGLPRTGTLSLKQALERLLGAPCYHMLEVGKNEGHVELWREALQGKAVWDRVFDGYVAAVDWPASAFWPELVAAYPDAPVLLSHRDADSWWKSVSTTIIPTSRKRETAWREMVDELFAQRLSFELYDRDAMIAAFEAHNARVRDEVPADRLLEWHPRDGWAPICRVLDVPVPEERFPHVNSTEDFLTRVRALAGD